MGAGRGRREDHISKLGDATLARVLSFLPAKEAARAAALSSRWRGSFAGVHAVSMEEPERPVEDYDDYGSYRSCGCDRGPTPPFASSITAALLARHRRPLRALRVAMCRYRLEDSSAVDQWVAYALEHAAAEPAGLELELHLRRVPVCDRAYAIRVRAAVGPVGSLKPQGYRDPPGDVVPPEPETDRPRSRSPVRSVQDGGKEHARRRGQKRRRRRSMSSSSGTSSSDKEEANRRARYRRRTYVSDEDDEERIPRRRRSISSDGTGSNSGSRSRSVSDGTESNCVSRSRSRSVSVSSSSSGSRARSVSDGSSDSNSGSRSRSLSGDAESNSHDDDTNRSRSRRRASRFPLHKANRSPALRPRSPSPPANEDDDVVSDDEMPLSPSPEPPWKLPPPEYTVPGRLFSCAVLRSLRIGPCRLSPPAAISLPSLEELLLTRVSDEEGDVQRLIAACPRLADLTLEACGTVTKLNLLGNRRLRRLVLQCCHNLATVAVDDTAHSLEYRGAVPNTSLLALPRGGHASFRSCKVDICGEEVSSAEELTKLGEFLQQLASTEHLHLQSARLGSGVDHGALTTLLAFTRLLHLELMGQLPRDEDGAAAIAAVSRILQHSPSLEVLSLVFTTSPADKSGSRLSWKGEPDAHRLRYNEHEILAAPAVIIPCLRNRVREINLVHYHGGRAQRTLAKFLLRNAPVLDKLYCGFALGPLCIQTKLINEIHGWAMNKQENRIFN